MGSMCRPLTPATSGTSWPLQVPHTSRNPSTGLVIHSEVVSVGLPRADVGCSCQVLLICATSWTRCGQPGSDRSGVLGQLMTIQVSQSN